ncbi:FAST kinase domain-containing protein 4-like [Stegodyphus dumicola]|uniref:FAST kinase domain-containing protein 4-like n=1 Tax=Stegodyphus dumicola TaxID=202533 RepID=UPI0015ACA49A|nr:FAST kinase domain-containing protein 4-like [Stegodyphus dumicola]XP_035211986.1 FAST kinase domain-containing protein 4-like [Stegodyphus dumicola]
MYHHIPVQLLKNFHHKSEFIGRYLQRYSQCKYILMSSVSHNIHNKHLLQNVENIQVSKYLQPFINCPLNEILATVNNKKSVSVHESVALLKALRMHVFFKGIDADSFKYDSRFQNLCEIFGKTCNTLEPNLLISGLRSLLEVGVPPDAAYVISAEKTIMQNLSHFSISNLILCLYFHHKFQVTELQKEVCLSLKQETQNRISEIASAADVLMLVHIFYIFDKSLQKDLAQKIIELLPLLNIHELCKILRTLSETSNRNISILNAVSLHLLQKTEIPDIKEAIDIFYAFKKLNYYDPKVLQYLFNNIMPSISSVEQPSLISGLLVTCGHLRWKHPGILDACGEWIVNHPDSCRSREYVAYILSAAMLNYSTENTEKTLNHILPRLKPSSVSLDIWLDVVWSLAILNKAEKKILQETLSRDFYKPLIDDSNLRVLSNKLKLMNLKAVLKIYHPECIFGCDLFLEPLKISESSEIEKGRKQVLDILSIFISKDKICTNQSTEMGIFIDAEFIMDKNKKLFSLSDYGVLSKETNITKPLPEGSKRISLLVMFHKDFTLNETSLTGINDLAVRILSASGYTPVLVPYDEFLRNKTEVKKAKYLLHKITEAVTES